MRSTVWTSQLEPGRTHVLEISATGPLRAYGCDWNPTPGDRAASFVHTNACGDFTLMAREHWCDLRGYPEFDLFSMNLDSILCISAHHGGAREQMLDEPMRIYHSSMPPAPAGLPKARPSCSSASAPSGLDVRRQRRSAGVGGADEQPQLAHDLQSRQLGTGGLPTARNGAARMISVDSVRAQRFARLQSSQARRHQPELHGGSAGRPRRRNPVRRLQHAQRPAHLHRSHLRHADAQSQERLRVFPHAAGASTPAWWGTPICLPRAAHAQHRHPPVESERTAGCSLTNTDMVFVPRRRASRTSATRSATFPTANTSRRASKCPRPVWESFPARRPARRHAPVPGACAQAPPHEVAAAASLHALRFTRRFSNDAPPGAVRHLAASTSA